MNEAVPGPHVLLIGMMGTGKTSVGRQLARRLKREFVDSDAVIVERVGMSIAEFFELRGEDAFRAEETKALTDLCASTARRIVSVGGGSPMREVNRPLIKAAGTVVWLRARPATLIARVGDGQSRPILRNDPAKVIPEIDAARRPVYGSLADIVVDVDDVPVSRVVERILASLHARTKHYHQRADYKRADSTRTDTIRTDTMKTVQQIGDRRPLGGGA